MLRIEQLLQLIDTLAPFELAETWDNVGLQIGTPTGRVKRIVFALEATPAVIREAAAHRADTLVTHHPLIFHPMKSVDESAAAPKLVAELIRRKIALITVHTNLDASPHGTNVVLARLLKLEPLGVLFPVNPPPHVISPVNGDTGNHWGLGQRALLPRPMTLRALARQLKEALHPSSVQMIGSPDRMVRRVAICTGSGGDVARRLSPEQFDVLITGEINHHGARDALTVGLSVLCAGHHETEAPAMAHLAGLIASNPDVKKAGVACLMSQSESSPIQVI